MQIKIVPPDRLGDSLLPEDYIGNKIHFSTSEGYQLINALELSRLHMGQFFPLTEHVHHKSWEEKDAFQRSLKGILFPELSGQSYHALHAKKVPEQARTAYDLIQVIRHRLAWHKIGKDPNKDQREWHGMMGLAYDQPLQVSEEPLAKIEKLEDGSWELSLSEAQKEVLEEHSALWEELRAGCCTALPFFLGLHPEDHRVEVIRSACKQFYKGNT